MINRTLLNKTYIIRVFRVDIAFKKLRVEVLNIKYNHFFKRKKKTKSNVFLSLTTGDYPGIMQLNKDK